MSSVSCSGNPKDEPGAIVCRVAQSFLRFGSYQLHASRGKKDFEIVRALADYAIRYHFPHLENMTRSESISLNTGDEDNSAVDLTSNKYAGKYIAYLEDNMGIPLPMKFFISFQRLHIEYTRRVMAIFH